MRTLSALFLASIHVGFFVGTAWHSAVAQNAPLQQSPQQLPQQPPPGQNLPPLGTETFSPGFNTQPSPQLVRYLLGPGDVIRIENQRPPGAYRLDQGDVLGIVAQRPPGAYLLAPGDAISVVVQRFPDLSFQASINPEGNIIVPLLGTVRLRGLTLEQAQATVRSRLNRFVVDPIVTLALVGQRPEVNFQAQVNPEGNIVAPLIGTISVKGLTLEQAQTRIRQRLRQFVVDPIAVSIIQQRPELRFDAAVSPEGNIVVPRLGTISVQGLTLEEAQEKIRLGLQKFETNPNTVVSLIQARPVQVTITGEVIKPGIYPLNVPRLADALLLAGGSSMTADLRAVQVRRTLLDGSTITQNIDLYTPLLNGGAVPNLRLQDGDAVIVPRREVAADDGYDRALVARSTLAQREITIRVLNYSGGRPALAAVRLPNGSAFIDALSGINPDQANMREIALVRFDSERGKTVTRRLDGRAVLAGDASQNVALQDNDVIVVGRNLIGRITNAIGLITQPFLDIRSFIRFFELFGGND
jgi:polysaccharide export outer membrane protein